MLPTENARANMVYRGLTPEVGDLACERIRPGIVRSFWQPTPEEVQKLLKGGVVELVVFGEPVPAVALNALTEEEALDDHPIASQEPSDGRDLKGGLLA